MEYRSVSLKYKTGITNFLGRFRSYIISLEAQRIRSIVQMGFLFLVLIIGFEFYGFVAYHQSGGQGAYFSRPPGVEAFLPISALISLKYWILSGVLNTIHPSGLVIFLIILILGLLFKKSFCSWVCPVGLFSESLWQLGNKIFGKTITPWRWLDYPLRSLKYLLLVFFLYAIVWQMNIADLELFIYSPYNKVADVKMLLFFMNISEFALWTIGVLVLLSVVIKNFWCRYLCPYGALLGFLSMFSPIKITRNAETCIDCEECTIACPNAIKVHSAKKVISDECTACALCISACPLEDTLALKTSTRSKPIPVWKFGVAVILVFVLGTSLANVTGYWHNSISDSEYQRRIQEINKPVYDHNRGQVPKYGPED